MGCCASRSNGVSPSDTPKKRPISETPHSLGFHEKQITVSAKIRRQGDENNNKRNSARRSRPPLKPKTPPPPKELEVATLVLLEGHEGYVDVAAWSPTDDVIVTGSSDRQAFLWHIHGHQAPDRVALEAEDLDSPVSSVAWSDDGEAFALGHDDGKVSLWTSAGEHTFTWWPHEAPVTCIAIKGPGKAPALLSGGDCSAVSQFIPGKDLQEFTQIYTTNDKALTWVEWVDKERFLCSDASGSIQLHHFDFTKLTRKITEGKYEDKEEPHRSFDGHAFGVYMVRVKPLSDRIFASCSVDSDIKIWDLGNKKAPLLHTLDEHLGYVTCIEWIPGADKLISSSFDYSLKIWDTNEGVLLHSLEKHADAVTKFSLSRDLDYIVSAGNDGDINFWDARDGEWVQSYEGAGRIMGALWNSQADKVVVTTYKVVTVLETNHNYEAKEARKRAAGTLEDHHDHQNHLIESKAAHSEGKEEESEDEKPAESEKKRHKKKSQADGGEGHHEKKKKSKKKKHKHKDKG